MGNERTFRSYRTFLEDNGYQTTYDTHRPDLTKQVTSYKQSIKDGHGVIVIAHSQGNYYTNEAYAELDEWMKDYFHMFGVATPADHVAEYTTYNPADSTKHYVKFHNDFIKVVVGGLPTNMYNPNTDHNLVLSEDAHAFYDSYLTTATTKEKILDFIETKIQEQVDAQSQWATDEEIDNGTQDYRITVKHIHDENIVMDKNVYPFAPNKKLYQVQDPLYPEDKEKKVYVKASFGGEEIIKTWDGQDEETQFLKLQGTGEIIETEKTCKDSSLFEIVSHSNINTVDWRVTVRNKETAVTQSGVYPFNLKGSLYQLESSEWVLASCGGTEILDNWVGQRNDYFKLQGTNEIISVGMVVNHSVFIGWNIDECPSWGECPTPGPDSDLITVDYWFGFDTGGVQGVLVKYAIVSSKTDYPYYFPDIWMRSSIEMATIALEEAIRNKYNNAKLLYSDMIVEQHSGQSWISGIEIKMYFIPNE